MSVFGHMRFGSMLSVEDTISLTPAKDLKFAGGWSIGYDASLSEMFLKKASSTQQSMRIIPTGGQLTGFWESESVLSTSDHRLKRDVSPLQVSSAQHSPHHTPDIASTILRGLKPLLIADPERRKYGFDAEEVESIIPDIVRSTLQGKMIVYQDLISLLALAAKERWKLMHEQRNREVMELAQIQQREIMLHNMETDLKNLQRRFQHIRAKF